MGGRGSGSRGQYQVAGIQNLAPSAAAASAANNSVFSDTDTQGYHDLHNGRKYFNDQNLTIDQQIATINYLSNTTENGSLYSMSQNMNYALANGLPLTANQQYVFNNMMGSMHNLGYNLKLTRYDHPAMVNNLLSQAGLTGGYENYSEAQLKSALVGTQFGENKMISTSYNNFKNAQNASTFTSRGVKITYHAKANTQAMMPGNGPGGALGEVVLAPSGNRTNMTVKDVRFTGQMARRQGTQSYTLPQIELIVEVDG